MIIEYIKFQTNFQLMDFCFDRNGKNDLAKGYQSTDLGVGAVLDQKQKLDPQKKVHLISPQELVSSQTNSNVRDEAPEQVSDIGGM